MAKAPQFQQTLISKCNTKGNPLLKFSWKLNGYIHCNAYLKVKPIASVTQWKLHTGLPQSLKRPWILGFPWKWICPWKVLEFIGPSLKFQLVVLDFLFCVFWNESLNGYSKLRGTRANPPPLTKKKMARFARSSLQVKYFSSSSCSYIILERLLSYPSFPKNIYRYLCILFQCINLFQNGQSLLLLWHNNQASVPSRIV